MSLVREKVLEAQGTGEYGVVGALEVKGGGAWAWVRVLECSTGVGWRQ